MLIILSTFVLCVSIWLLYELYEHEAVQINKHVRQANGLVSNRELRFCMIADFHDNKKRCEAELLKKIKEYQPDAVLICGDMIDKHKTKHTDALHFLSELAEIAPVFYSYGNHETTNKRSYRDAWEQYISQLPQNCVLLDNETVFFSDYVKEAANVWISGLTLPEIFYKKGSLLKEEEAKLPQLSCKNEISSFLPSNILPSKDSSSGFHILLAHHPEYDKMYQTYHPDFILSGHLHGGLIRLPLIGGLISPRCRFPRKDAGFYKSGNAILFVSRGLGSHTVLLRVLNRTELTFLTLLPDRNKI